MPTYKHAIKPPSVVDIREHGANGANTVDNAAFLAAMTAAKNGARTAPDGLASDPLGTVTIEIPAGDYRITDLQGLIGKEATATKTRGLRIRGAGSDLTQIIFAPATAGELCYNRYWQNIKFEGITFSTTVAGSTFMNSNAISGSAPQEYTFQDIKWNGPWKYGFNLVGTNNNCEFRFNDCMTTGMVDDGAFLFVGPTDTSDQFVNYWFKDFKHWSTNAPMIDMARGGHVHIKNVDASAWGTTLTAPKKLFNLRGNSHGNGVMQFTADMVRVEPKNAFAGLLYSEWPEGNVSIRTDWSSQVGTYTYGDIIEIVLGNTSGPIYNFYDSYLAGGVKVQYSSAAYVSQPSINFNNCTWRQKLTPSEVVTYDESAAGGNRTRPAVRFNNCRSYGNQNPRVAAGASVWDATVGYSRGPLVKSLEKRSVMVQGIYGSLADGDGTFTVNLPVGALITGLRAVSPIMTNGDTDGGTWNLRTTDATPVTIASATVSTNMGQGYSVNTELPVPFLCDTRTRATVTLSATGVSQSRYEAFVVLEGYW